MATSKHRTFGDRAVAGEFPVLALVPWTLVPLVAGTVLANMEPDRSTLLYIILPTLAGLAVGCFAAFTENGLARVLRLPGQAVGILAYLFGGGTR